MAAQKMDIQLIIIIIILFVRLKEYAAAAEAVAKPGCSSTCGSNVTIPYPFGIGHADCYFNEWFEVVCHDGRPHLRKYYGQNVGSEVVDFDVVGFSNIDRVRINTNVSRMHMCEDRKGFLAGNLTAESPFYYSYNFNKFMLVGCGNAVFYNEIGNQSGCTSICDLQHSTTSADSCIGVNCCQGDFSSLSSRGRLTHYYLNFSNYYSITGGNSCASAFFVERDWYPENWTLFSDNSASLVDVSIPVVLEWRFTKSMPGPGLADNPNCYPISSIGYWICDCPCGRGNPYLPGGCPDFDSGYPYCPRTPSRKRLILIVVGATTFGIIFILTLSYLLYKFIKRRKERRLKRKNFKRNGGLLLEKHLSSNESIVEKIKVFTGKNLSKATDDFNEDRVLGHGGQGVVYKGMLDDGKIVAIKKLKLMDSEQVELLINEVVIYLQVDHRNVVKLLGCCLETEVPMLVYEFIPNGTLYNLIHGENDSFPLTWEVRIRILLEVAEALAYLHSATSAPIYHRDIKSSNILLDEKYRAKLSDFGTSKHFAIDQTHLTTLVRGTFGYLDPEYFHSSQYTEKSDVYSFGVVVVELLTGEKPICSTLVGEGSSSNLATRFIEAMEENDVYSILDPQVVATANEGVSTITRLAQRCLSSRGRNRPTMKEVVMELEGVKNNAQTQSASGVQLVSHGATHKEEEEDVQLSSGSAMHTTTFNTTSSSSDAFPLLSDTF